MRLHAIKAQEGDCLLLESGDARFMLIDGGPPGTWADVAGTYVRDVVGAQGTIDVLLVSHVDADHIVGVLDLLAEIERDRADEQPCIRILDLWHNSFIQTIDTPDGTIAKSLQTILDVAGAQQFSMPETAVSFFGIAEGARLRRSATKLSIPINAAFQGGSALPDGSRTAIALGDVRLQIVGPTAANLAKLRAAWLEWLEKHGDRLATPDALANADRSVPNLSSIVILAEAGGRSVLLTGDARGDHILQGLEAGGHLTDGSIHVDVLKVQHHGSARNANAKFFERVTADVYVISANGRHSNPDEETLVWIVEASKRADRRIRILVTHEAPSLATFRASHPPSEWDYELEVADKAAHVVEL